MTLRRQLTMFLVASLVLSGATVWLASRLQAALERVAREETRRFASISLADELRQSSDDLTRFARTYVQTGDRRFVQYFERVLAIRDGEHARPRGYEGVYWDLVIEEPARLEENLEEAVSLRERMRRLGFTDAEFALLADAQRRSDALVRIEERAFAAMEGRFQDAGGKYSIEGAPDPALAQRLLYSAEYHRAKSGIMEPIGRFQAQVNERTEGALTAVRHEAEARLMGTFASAGSLLVLLVLLGVIVNRRVLRRTSALADTAERITGGDLDARSNVRGADELGTLGATFDSMVSRLAETLGLVTAARDRMEQELNIGRDIQMSMIPLTFPAFPDRDEFAIHAALKPAREVGGDFYDFFLLDDDHFAFCVGDVSGKGVPAALFMAVARTLVRAHAASTRSPARILTRVNDELSQENPNCMFVTFFMGVLDVRSGECVYTNAGHNPPYRLRETSVEAVKDRHGPVLGAMEGLAYEESRVVLSENETLLVFTDGVTEATSPADELLGEDRLERWLDDRRTLNPAPLVEDLVGFVERFEAGTEQADDITLFVLRFGRPSMAPVVEDMFVFKNEMAEIGRVLGEAEAFCEKHGLDKSLSSKLSIVLDDVLANVVSYAYDDGEPHDIELRVELSEERLAIQVIDDGKPFDPLAAARPDTTLGLDEREEGGLGIELVRGLSSSLHYERRGDRNVLTVGFDLPTGV